jgi:2-C-methyl-D-erythritol 2,4-cyclodiphosphate synthase
MPEQRVGIGFDAHAFADGRRLVLAGVEIDHPRGLAGHSDADLVSHAVTDALLGAAGGADIGALYPSDDPSLEGASSIDLLARAWAALADKGWRIVNVDAVVIMQEPRLAPHREAMRARLAQALAVEPERVTVRASTTDRLGFAGRGEGAACQAVALLETPA